MALIKFGSLLKIAATGTALEDVITERPAVEKKILEVRNNEFLYFRARAISAGDQGPLDKDGNRPPNPNGNGDFFSRAELEATYQTFVGRQLFLNHESDHPIKSIGKILDAEAIEDPETGEYYIECIAKIDKKLHPEISRKIETGELNTVSMGCSCESSMCSICGLTIHSDEDEKCEHLRPTGILKTFTAEIDAPEFGITKGAITLAYSINSGLSFNELSIVNVPADSSAFIKGIIASNLRHQINKKASLDDTEKKYLQELLNSLDDETKKQIKADFCVCELPKEDKHMSDKVKKENEEVKATTQNEVVHEVLAKMNALQYIEFANWLEKKMQKSKPSPESIKTVAKEEVKSVEDSVIERAISAVKNSTLGKLFSNAVRKEIEKSSNKPAETKSASLEIKAEFVEDKEIFGKSHWTLYKGDRRILRAYANQLWDTDQLTDEKYRKWTASTEYGKKLVETYKRLGFAKTAEILGVGYKLTDVKDSKVETPAKSEFIKPGEKTKADKEVDKTQDALHKADETDVGAHLELSKPESEKKEAAANEVMDKVRCNKCQTVYPEDITVCPKCKTDAYFMQPFVPMKEDVEHKEAVAPEGWEPTVLKMKKHKEITNPWALSWWMKEKGYEPEKKSLLEYHAEYEEEMKKKADESVTEDATPKLEEPKLEEPKLEEAPKIEEPKIDELKVEPTPVPVPESAFDKLDEGIVIAEGMKAEKDKETKEIVVTDASGSEVKRFPDGFGTDVPSVMKLLQAIVGIEAPKVEEAPVIPEVPKVEEPKQVPEHEMETNPALEPVKEDMAASQKAEITKKADELSKKEEELKTKETELNAKRFANVVQARTERCKKVVATMLQKDMLATNEEDVKAELVKGSTLLDAREVAFRKIVDRKIKALLSMDENALSEFENSINEVQIKKEASKRLTTPLNLSYSLPTEEDEYKNIFDSMGSGGSL